MCWFPRQPWRLRIARDHFSHIIRCRECPGCLEFERRRLGDRLQAKYSVPAAPHQQDRVNPVEQSRSTTGAGTSFVRRRVEAAAAGRVRRRSTATTPLFLVRIYAPLERHADICHALHRRPGLQLEPGLYRLGTTSFAVLARSRSAIPLALRRLGLEHRIESIRLSRGRRAWRAITSGVAVARVAYGEQVKRWYARGLPPAERQKWEILKMPQGSHYQRASSPRAWNRGNLVLVPPELWSMRRCDRRALRSAMATACSPEAAAFVTSLISGVAQARSMRSPVIASSKPRPEREALMRQFAHVARVADVARASAPPHDLTPSLLGEGGYTSSEHSQGELLAAKVTIEPPPELSWDERQRRKEQYAAGVQSERAWTQQRVERQRRELAEVLERLRKKIVGGS